jgi:membrane protease YdiL (CAAX protease family)
MTDPYAPHQEFVRRTGGSAELGPVLIIVIVIELMFVVSPLLVGVILSSKWRMIYDAGITPIGVLAQLATFTLIAAALVCLTRKLHGRGFWSMVGPLGATLHDSRIAAIAVFVLLVVQTILPPWIVFAELVETRSFLSWAIWIVPTIAVLIVQTGTEELYFRGYLQQQCALISNKPIIWMGLPSVLFGLGHYPSGIGPADGVLYALWATLLGLACADLTARTGNIGAAVGLHLSNNLFAFLLVAEVGAPSSGLALFLYPPTDHSQFDYSLQALLAPWVIFEVIILTLIIGVMWLAARIAIRR